MVHLDSLDVSYYNARGLELTSRTARALLPGWPSAAALRAAWSRVRATVASASWVVYVPDRSSRSVENVTDPGTG